MYWNKLSIGLSWLDIKPATKFLSLLLGLFCAITCMNTYTYNLWFTLFAVFSHYPRIHTLWHMSLSVEQNFHFTNKYKFYSLINIWCASVYKWIFANTSGGANTMIFDISFHIQIPMNISYRQCFGRMISNTKEKKLRYSHLLLLLLFSIFVVVVFVIVCRIFFDDDVCNLWVILPISSTNTIVCVQCTCTMCSRR